MFALAARAHATKQLMELPPEQRAWYRNPDGSCVQCSIGMASCGAGSQMAATTLLWNTVYGAAERGGSWPDRVANYCNRRGIKAWNVTGDATFAWMRWACQTRRFAAIGAGRAHFQTLYGHDPAASRWYVCNNNSTGRIDEYSDDAFRRLHLASGPWVVVLRDPCPENPVIVRWWE